MKDALSQMGMPIAFSNSADFNIFNNVTKLSIDGIFHKAVIQVDEKGTVVAICNGNGCSDYSLWIVIPQN